MLLTRKDPKIGHRDSAGSNTRKGTKGKEMPQQRDQWEVHQGLLPYLWFLSFGNVVALFIEFLNYERHLSLSGATAAMPRTVVSVKAKP